MAAGDILVRVRNAQDNGWVEQIIPAQAGSPLRLDYTKRINAGGVPAGTPTALATAGAGTLLAAAILSGMILRDPAGNNRTDTTDTAANLIAAIPALAVDYGEFEFFIVNTADAAETITLAGGVGVTLQDIATIAQNSMDKFCLFRTSGTTLVMRRA